METRQAQLFMQLYNRFQDVEFHQIFIDIMDWEFKDLDEYWEKYGHMSAQQRSLGSFFEGLGVLVKRGLIDVTIADDLISGLIMRFWNKFEPIVVEARKRMNYPQYGEWVEYLYNQIRQIAEQQHPELKT